MRVLGDVHADDPGNREALLAASDAADADVAHQLSDCRCDDPSVPTWSIAWMIEPAGIGTTP